MKRQIALALLGILLFAFNAPAVASNPQKTDRIEVIYFHGKQRCVTCRAVEKATKEVLDTSFANEVKSGKIQYRIIDISQPSNEKIAEKYEVSWSSLFVNRWKKGQEAKNNLTELAFSYAKKSPDRFKSALKKKLEELLKQK
ncbi:MAG: thioredoxin [Bacteroidia bacterium]|nr:thioredoxin [Bacteroidia bacterium]